MRRYNCILGLLLFVFVSCRNSAQQAPVEQTRFLMDTAVRVAVYDREIPRRKIDVAIDRAFEAMKEIEAKTSIHIDTSEVSRMNQAAGGNTVRISSETMDILYRAIETSRTTQGAFDVTIGVIKSLWAFDSDNPSVPDESFIRSLLSKVDYRKIHLRDTEAFLSEPGMQIDMGGIAKGFVIDQGVQSLKKSGIHSGLVEAGGDLRILGLHPRRNRWKIGVRHPRSQAGELIGVIETDETSIATSGDYERYFIKDGKRYHHILDPNTGFPASGCVSVTIVTESALMADALATAVFVLGHEEGMSLIDRLEGVEGLILYEEEGLKYNISDGLQQMMQWDDK